MPRKVTNNALVATLAGVALTALLAIAGYYITRPYIQYEEGRFYKSGSTSIVSLRLENKGYFDAEQVTIETAFPEPITEITSGDAVSPLSVTSGGKGFKTAVGTISRITPAQGVYVYFAVDNSSGIVGDTIPGFVRKVTFRNGQGSVNPPPWQTLALSVFSSMISAILIGIVAHFYFKYRKQAAELESVDRVLTKWEMSLEEKVKEWEDGRADRERELAELTALSRAVTERTKRMLESGPSGD